MLPRAQFKQKLLTEQSAPKREEHLLPHPLIIHLSDSLALGPTAHTPLEFCSFRDSNRKLQSFLALNLHKMTQTFTPNICYYPHTINSWGTDLTENLVTTLVP